MQINANSWYYSPDHGKLCQAALEIGLPRVYNYRLNLLSQEERSFQEQLDHKAQAFSEMVPLLVIRIESVKGGSHE